MNGGRLIGPALLTASAALLLLPGLGRSDLFNPDEPREAEMAREMAATGDLLVPRLNGEPFLEKPPLQYWMVGTAYRLGGGAAEGTARAVSSLCGVAAVLLTWFFGRRMVGETAALLGAAALLTSFEFWWVARRCTIDMPLLLLVLIACGALFRGMTAGPGDPAGAASPAGARGRAAWLLLGYAAAGAAVMQKGIIGLGLPMLAAGGFLIRRRNWRGLLRHGMIPGALLALLPAVGWTLLLWRRLGEGAAREFVWVNNVQRFIGGAAGKGHEQPLHYYLPTLLLEMAPWSLLLPFAIGAAWVALRPGTAGGDAPPPGGERAGLPFLLSWLLLPLLVLSIASTKRGTYLLPLYPAAALLVGWFLSRMDESAGAGAGRWRSLRRIAPALLFGTAVALSAAGLGLLRAARPLDWAAPTILLAALLPAGVAAFRALRSERGATAGFYAAAMTGAVHLALALGVLPGAVAAYGGGREAGTVLGRLAEQGDRIVLYRFQQGMLGNVLFYARRTFPNLDEPAALVAHLRGRPEGAHDRFGPRPMALVREDHYLDLRDGLPVRTVVTRRFARRPPPFGRAAAPLVLVAAEEIGDNAARPAASVAPPMNGGPPG